MPSPIARLIPLCCLLLALAPFFQAQETPAVTVTPAAGPVEEATFDITISGLQAESAYTIEILFAGEVVFSSAEMSDAAGQIEYPIISTAGDAPGIYTLQALHAGEIVASAEFELTAAEGDFSIEAPTERAVRLELQPAAIQAGQALDISVSGLAPFDSVTAQVVSADAILIDTILARASLEGDLTMTFNAAEDLPAGDYMIDLFIEAEKLASAAFAVLSAPDQPQPAIEKQTEEPAEERTEEPVASAPVASVEPVSEASAAIEPGAAPLGSSHLVTISGLGAAETITLDVAFAGETVYRAEKTADANGGVRVELLTEATDKTGDYLVSILRQAGNQPTVVLTATAAEEAPVEVAPPASDAVEVIESRLVDGGAQFDFDGEAGKYLRVSIASTDFDPALALLDRDGAIIAFNDDSRGQKNPSIGPLALPYSGRYKLEISAQPLMMAQGAIDGDFVISLEEANPASIAFDAATPFALGADAPTQYFSLPVETGDSLTVTLDSGGSLDTVLQVVAPDGSQFAFDDDSGAGFDAELSNLIFDRAATYILAVSSFDSAVSGQGALSIRRNPVHALEDGETVITLNDKAIRDLVIFDAQEDDNLILNLSKLSGHVEDLYVTAAVEGMEVMSYSTMGVPAELPLAFVMPMSGRVVVTLEKFGFDDAISLEVSLRRAE